MASSFGISKQSTLAPGLKALDVVGMNKKCQVASPRTRPGAEARIALTATTTTNWLMDHELTPQTMVSWGNVLKEHLITSRSIMDADFAKPLAKYLNFVSTLGSTQLFGTGEKRSTRYESLCRIFRTMAFGDLYNPSPSMAVLARDKMVNFEDVVGHLQTMRSQQYTYDMHILNNNGELRDFAQGALMRGLLSLSFNDIWSMPTGKPLYHEVWTLLDEDDIEHFSDEYDPSLDICAHLAETLPGSTKEALEFYQYSGHDLLAGQKQQILSMSLSALKYPEGLQTVVDAVFLNDDDGWGKRLLMAMNPATKILEAHLALHDSPQEMVAHLASRPEVKHLINFADDLRNKVDGDTMVAQWVY